MADENKMGIAAKQQVMGDMMSSEIVGVAIGLMLALVGLVVFLSIRSSPGTETGRRLLSLSTNPGIGNLFLKLPFRLSSDTSEVHSGYLRSLSMRHAELVVDRSFEKGAVLTLDLARLPDFPGSTSGLTSEVATCRRLPGANGGFSVRVKFVVADGLKAPLHSYLTTLIRQQGSYSQA